MRKKVYIKEAEIKNQLDNFLYRKGKIEKDFYQLLISTGVKEDKYVLKNYNSENCTFDCEGYENNYTIRLGKEYADNWYYPTIEITNKGISINYFYYLNEDFEPDIKTRDYTSTINGKEFNQVANYSPYKPKEDFYMRKVKKDNIEAFFYIIDPNLDHDKLDKELLKYDFTIDWPSVYNLINNYGDLKKYIVLTKVDGTVQDFVSNGFSIDEMYHYYSDNKEKDNVKIKIRDR